MKVSSIIIGLILVSILVLNGCIQKNIVTCNKPYIVKGDECCLDQNDNKICDEDESTTEVIIETPTTKEDLTIEDIKIKVYESIRKNIPFAKEDVFTTFEEPNIWWYPASGRHITNKFAAYIEYFPNSNAPSMSEKIAVISCKPGECNLLPNGILEQIGTIAEPPHDTYTLTIKCQDKYVISMYAWKESNTEDSEYDQSVKLMKFAMNDVLDVCQE